MIRNTPVPVLTNPFVPEIAPLSVTVPLDAAWKVPLVPRAMLKLIDWLLAELLLMMPRSVTALPLIVKAPAPLPNDMLVRTRPPTLLTFVARVLLLNSSEYVPLVAGVLFAFQLVVPKKFEEFQFEALLAPVQVSAVWAWAAPSPSTNARQIVASAEAV